MVRYRQSYDLPEGTAVTAANSGTTGDAFTIPTPAGTPTATARTPPTLLSGRSCRVVAATADGVHHQWTQTAGAIFKVLYAVLLDSTRRPVGGAFCHWRVRSAANANVCKFMQSTAGVFSVQNRLGSGIKNFNGNTAMPNGWYWVQVWGQINTTTGTAGTLNVVITRADGAALTDNTLSSGSVDLGTSLATTWQGAKPEASGGSIDYDFDYPMFEVVTSGTGHIPTPKFGAGSGGASWGGSGSGSTPAAPTRSGQGSAGWSLGGSATGRKVPQGEGSAAWQVSGSASGEKVTSGQGSAGWSAAGQGVGRRVPQGSGQAGWHAGGSATGEAVRGGSGSSAAEWSGQGSGSAPTITPNSGQGSAGWHLAGSASGTTTRTGSGSTTVQWSSTGAGSRTPTGAGSAAVQWAVSGAGSTPGVGVRSGQGQAVWLAGGQGQGTTTRTGSGSAAHQWGVAGVGRQVAGGSGEVGWEISTTGSGSAVRSGSGVAVVVWTGTAASSSARVGVALVEIRWGGKGAGRVAAVTSKASALAGGNAAAVNPQGNTARVRERQHG